MIRRFMKSLWNDTRSVTNFETHVRTVGQWYHLMPLVDVMDVLLMPMTSNRTRQIVIKHIIMLLSLFIFMIMFILCHFTIRSLLNSSCRIIKGVSPIILTKYSDTSLINTCLSSIIHCIWKYFFHLWVWMSFWYLLPIFWLMFFLKFV